MSCYLTNYDKKNYNYKTSIEDDFIKQKDNRKKEKDKHKPTKVDIARLMQESEARNYYYGGPNKLIDM